MWTSYRNRLPWRMVCLLLLLWTPAMGQTDILVTWDAPTTNADGSPLTDLGGYALYYRGPTTSGPEARVEIPAFVGGGTTGDPVTTYVMEMLPPGEWLFQLTAIDTAGNASDRSDAAVLTVPPDPDAPRPRAGVVKRWIEAEAFPLDPAVWVILPGASGGLHAQHRTDAPTYFAFDAPVPAATVQVDIPVAGDYVLWGRFYANSDGATSPPFQNDSLWLQVNGSQRYYWTGMLQDRWTWQTAGHDTEWAGGSYPGTATRPLLFSLPAGTHTLTILPRENGVFIDRFLLTNDLTFVPEGVGDPGDTYPRAPAAPTDVVLNCCTYEE